MSKAGLMPSLHLRLMLAAFLVLAAFLGLTGLALDEAFRKSAEASMRSQLQGHIYSLLAAADVDEQGRMQLPQTLPDPRFSNPDSGLYAQISGEDGNYHWQSPSLVGKEIEFLHTTAPGKWRYDKDATGQKLYTVNFGVIWEDRNGVELRYTLAAGGSIEPLLARIEGFRTTLWSWLGGVALLLLLAQAAVLRWGLKPLRTVARELRRIECGEASSLSGRYPRELQILTGNINSLITQSQASQERYRNSLGDLTHSLKTPLAVIQNAADSGDPGQLQIAVNEQIPRMNEIVQYQLQRAAASGQTPLARAIPVAPLAEKIINALDKVYRDKAVRHTLLLKEDALFFGHEGDLMEILGNLLDNAYKYCRSRVRIRAERKQHPPTLTLLIEDDGPGIAPPDIDIVLRRGRRADQHSPGQGIGLSVAHEIIHLYKGRMEIGRSDLGGARIEIRLPVP